MSNKLTTFIDGLILYDYILFGSVFALFILFIILGIILREKTVLAIFLIIFSFSILILGPTLGYIKMHEYLYKNSVSLVSQKRLTYTKAVVVYGVVKNLSKFDFKSCKITASAHKVSENSLKNYLFKFKSFKNMSILEKDILKGQEREFKVIIEPFTYSKDYNISLEASCR
jgi:hypothetical protein